MNDEPDYSDRYFLGGSNPDAHRDFSLKESKITVHTKGQESEVDFDTPPTGQVTKAQLRTLYELENRGDVAGAGKQLARVAYELYPNVVRRCTYTSVGGERRFVTGGTPALVDAIKTFREFVVAYEKGIINFLHIDNVIYACHNNGVFADVFISDSPNESDAIEFLDELSGIRRNKASLS